MRAVTGSGSSTGAGHRRHDLVQQIGGIAAAQARLGAGDQAMCQDRRRQPLDVVGQHVAAAADRRQRLRRAVQRQRAARAGAELDRGVHARGAHEAHDVVLDGLGDVDLATQALHAAQLGGIHDRRQLVEWAGGAEAADDVLLVLFGWVADRQAQQEAVELRFGQRERALQLDRVLRREHQERPGQRARLAFEADLPLVHTLEQRRLGARRGAIDLVGEHDLGEDRPRPELELLHASG